MPLKILAVVGARPNFMKIAPLMWEAQRRGGIAVHLVHTGQHYDEQMSQLFFEELRMPRPDVNLEVGSGSHAVQTAEVMKRFEPVVLERAAATLVLVVGDVNSTIACALTAVKLGVPVAHVEAGLRSFDRTMPEEINRILTDAISHWLFVTEPSGVDNLRKEGVPDERDLLRRQRDDGHARWPAGRAVEASRDPGAARRRAGRYAVLTLHRPANVDDPAMLGRLMAAIERFQRELPIVFPVHPRTRQAMNAYREGGALPNLIFTEPLGYLDFMKLLGQARLVLTDSGGVQEETTFLGVPCLTMRNNTERPVTVTAGDQSARRARSRSHHRGGVAGAGGSEARRPRAAAMGWSCRGANSRCADPPAERAAGMTRRVLIVTYHFPPSAASGTFRLLGFARHLPRFGWAVHVVAPPEMPWDPVDPALTAQVPAETRYDAVAYPKRAPRLLRIAAPYGVWLPPAWRACRRAIGRQRPDVVLTSGPPHVVHLLGMLLQRTHRLPWIADFRDPWISGMVAGRLNWQQRWLRYLEKQVIAHADRILANAPNAARLFQETYPRQAHKVVTLTNGFDPPAPFTFTRPLTGGRASCPFPRRAGAKRKHGSGHGPHAARRGDLRGPRSAAAARRDGGAQADRPGAAAGGDGQRPSGRRGPGNRGGAARFGG